ncbi:sugar phosphate isomerase/epimerase family protein [Paragemmobacter straminiformis]|uniref:Sugar phosphate isomerase/epimerase n=1 Tax=Paragemmobacter straminiformis TaxID=2045119 RepID=A0A842IFE9_9RHOB|nr:sugar phosphate isomerase/epimerase [Gemmobacter straminiformis]MBC2837378.1 sugar phosphate isomerase/epimerase [Gemmobacter straminiformis]
MTSFQLYTSRNFPPLRGTLEMLAATGFTGVEGYGGVYGNRAQLAELAEGLAATGLVMRTGHFGLQQLEEEPDFVLEVARTVGMERAYCPYIMPEDRPRDMDGWHALGARLQKAGAPLRAAGLGFGWHNHDFEFIPQAGRAPIEALFAGGPDLEWEIDVAWVVRGGEDALAWIERFGGRITSAHVKDVARAGENADEDGWADLGDGIVPWAKALPALRALGVKHFVIEHDNPSDQSRFARRSLAAFRAL